MLKTLIKKEVTGVLHRSFRGRGRGGKPGKGFGVGMAILLIVLAVYLMAMFAVLSFTLCISVAEPGMGWLYFLLLTCIAILGGTLGSAFSTFSSLYLAKDNDLLLSLPIPIKDIIISRLMSVWLMSLLYSGIVSLPMVGVYLAVIGFSVPALLGGLVLILLISLVVLGLSCLLGWGVAKLSLRLKNRSFLTVLIALAFLVVYYVIYFRIMGNAKTLLEGILAAGGTIRAKARLLYLLGAVGEGNWLGMLAWAGIVGAFLALLWLVLKKTFLSIATASVDTKRAVYREKTAKQSSADAALLRREWYRFSSSANYMLNCGLGLLLLPGLSIYLLIKGSDLIAAIGENLSTFSGLLTVGMGAVCTMLSSMMDITAPSVSLEGRTIWQVQSLPVTPWQALRAKLRLHLALVCVPSALWAVCVFVIAPGSLAEKLLLLALSLLSMLWIALLGLALGVRLANLNWTNEIVPIKQSAAVLVTLLAGLALGGLIIGLYFVFGWLLGAAAWLGIFCVLLAIGDVLLYLWLHGSGARRFSEL